MYSIIFYVPITHLELVKEAMFIAGAGRCGAYSHCAWQVLGQGQFLPLAGSQPFIGQTGQVETVDEYRVEMVCAEECIHTAIAALKQTHPYETPAYQVVRLEENLCV